MEIQTTVFIRDGDSFAYTADAAAAQVLAALGGDPTKDYAIVSVRQDTSGTHGTPPETTAP